jgi:hypothetical protein
MKSEIRYILLPSLALAIGMGCGYTILKESNTAGKQTPSGCQVRTDEAKLDPTLLHYLRLAESAHTSEADKSALEGYLVARGDSSGRIYVIMHLWGMSGFANVMPVLDSLNAQVGLVGKSIPFLMCWVRPIDLRQLIRIGSVKRIEIPIRGETR